MQCGTHGLSGQHVLRNVLPELKLDKEFVTIHLQLMEEDYVLGTVLKLLRVDPVSSLYQNELSIQSCRR